MPGVPLPLETATAALLADAEELSCGTEYAVDDDDVANASEISLLHDVESLSC